MHWFPSEHKHLNLLIHNRRSLIYHTSYPGKLIRIDKRIPYIHHSSPPTWRYKNKQLKEPLCVNICHTSAQTNLTSKHRINGRMLVFKKPNIHKFDVCIYKTGSTICPSWYKSREASSQKDIKHKIA